MLSKGWGMGGTSVAGGLWLVGCWTLHMLSLGQSRNTWHLGIGSGGWCSHRCMEATQTSGAWNPPFPAPVICWLTSHCAGGLGIWDALSELVLAGSVESFLKGLGSWQLAGWTEN